MSKEMREVDFIITTMDRYHLLSELLDSIFNFYPDAKVTVADQSQEIDSSFYQKWNLKDLRVLPLPYDCGLSMARNILVEKTDKKYKLLLEDDFLFTKDTKIEKMVSLMRVADVAGGGVYKKDYRIPFEHYFARMGNTIFQVPDGDIYESYEDIKYKQTGCVLNFALFKASVFDDVKWHNGLKLREHQHFFYRLKNRVVFTDDVRIMDNKKGQSREYKALKGRDQFWRIAMQDLGIDKFKYLSGQVVALEEGRVYRYREAKEKICYSQNKK